MLLRCLRQGPNVAKVGGGGWVVGALGLAGRRRGISSGCTPPHMRCGGGSRLRCASSMVGGRGGGRGGGEED